MKILHRVKDREKGCPFGHRCDDCNLYQPMFNKDVNGNVVSTEYDCQWNNIAMLLSLSKERILGVQQAVESARNESTERQDTFLKVLTGNDHARLSSK